MNSLTSLTAREIFDSRGTPTVEVDATLSDGSFGRAAVPSGASTGVYEAGELRDGDKGRLGGKGVKQAVANVTEQILPKLKGMEMEQVSLDQAMIELDGTPNKGKLGANAILGVSLAAARAGSLVNQMPLYKFIREFYRLKLADYQMPVPLVNVINGGAHADSNLDFQEFWIIPQNIKTIKERVRAISEIFHKLGEVIKKNGLDTDVGNEGGYAPNVTSTESVWQMIIEAIKNNFDENCVDHSQVIKVRENQIVIALETKNIFGEMPEEKITMHKIDGYCGTLRERIPIYVRETKAFSKKKQNVENRLDIFQAYRNFIWAKKGKTPAMKEGITDKVWTWNKIILWRV